MGSPNHTPKRFKTILRLVAAVAVLSAWTLALVGFGSACSKQAKTFVDLMSTVPDSTGHFAYWAIDDLNEDEDLWGVYGRFQESADAHQLEEFVPVLATVKQSAKAVSYDNTSLKNPVTVLHGDFDINSTEARLETIGYSETRYRDVGIWILQDNQTIFKSVALRSTAILMGDDSDLRACIDVIVKNNTRSLNGDPYIRLVADKLPNGVIVEIDRADISHGEQYPDLVTYGKSYAKANKDMLKLTAVYMFSDGPAAGAARQQVKDYLAASYKEIQVRRDGNFVIATSQISIAEFAQSLGF
jgi:hypothetical protein